MNSARLQAIPVRIEHSSGNVEPLLHEIRHSLERLARDGTVSCIDLAAVPLAPGEEQRIVDFLGEGEVQARVNALGSSEVAETRYPGVWIVTHRDEGGGTLTRLIEIAFIPEILRAQDEDVAAAVARLAHRLSAIDPSGAP